MNDYEVAMNLGRVYRGDASLVILEFPGSVSSGIHEVLARLDTSLASGRLKSMHEFVCLEHRSSFEQNPLFVAFFSQFPLDFLLTSLRISSKLLWNEPWVHDMLQAIIYAFRMQPCESRSLRFCTRLAAGLPTVEVLSSSTITHHKNCLLNQCLDLLIFMSSTCRDMVRDQHMFRNLATHMHRYDHRQRIMSVLEVGELYTDTHLLEDLTISLTRLIVQRQNTEPDVLDCAEHLLRLNADLRSERFLLTHTSQLWRTGWPTEIGPILSHLLDTSNVSLVVELDRLNQLAGLIQKSHSHSTVEWRAVRGLLRHIVPERVRSTLHESYTRPFPAPSECTCSITLDYIVNPVTISDGNTYERDAIMRHFTTSGFVSPLTRQRVAPHVFATRAVIIP